jgi:hypothetical protein
VSKGKVKNGKTGEQSSPAEEKRVPECFPSRPLGGRRTTLRHPAGERPAWEAFGPLILNRGIIISVQLWLSVDKRIKMRFYIDSARRTTYSYRKAHFNASYEEKDEDKRRFA